MEAQLDWDTELAIPNRAPSSPPLRHFGQLCYDMDGAGLDPRR